MKPRITQEKLCNVPSNISPEELLVIVEHYYPNLKGPLLSMVQVFDSLLEERDTFKRQLSQHKYQPACEVTLLEEPEITTIEFKCSHCGQEIEIELL